MNAIVIEAKSVTICFNVRAAIGSIVVNVLILPRYLLFIFFTDLGTLEIVIVEGNLS